MLSIFESGNGIEQIERKRESEREGEREEDGGSGGSGTRRSGVTGRGLVTQ